MLIGTGNTISSKITAEPVRENFEILVELIEQKSTAKCLGVDTNHTKAVALKATLAIAMIRYSKKFIPKHTLKKLYQRLAEPHFRFCCSI